MKAIKLTVVQRKYLYIVLIIVFSLLLGMGVGQFTKIIDRLFMEQTTELLMQTSQNQKLLLEMKMQNQRDKLELIVQQINEQQLAGTRVIPVLAQIQAQSDFTTIGFVEADGQSYDDLGRQLELNWQTLAPELERQMTANVPVVQMLSDDKTSIVIALPISSDSELTGAVFGVTPIADLSLTVQSPSFAGKSFGYVIDNQGTVITSFNDTKIPNGANYLTTMQNVHLNSQAIEQLGNEQLLAQPAGFISYERDEPYIAYYEPLGVNGWTIVSVAPESEFTSLAEIVNWQGVWLTGQIFLVFGAFILYIIAEHKRSEQLIHQQLEWTKLNELKYKIALEQSDTMIFEYLVTTNQFEFTPTTLTMVGLDTEMTYTPQSFYELGCFSDKVATDWESLFTRIQAGEAKVSLTVPIKFPYKAAEWYDIYFTTIFDDNHQPLRAIGKFVNVHAQHQHMAQLVASAQKDSLTGVYNKKTTESLISGILEHQPEAMHALFIIDIDDFKFVNDEFGHHVGDQVITEVAKLLQRTCRETDIVGRIGGDEFIIFLKDIHKPTIIAKKAEQICDTFKNYYLENHNHKISGSVGVALAPTHSRDFHRLYELADQAMYQVKKTGKDRWQLALAELPTSEQ